MNDLDFFITTALRAADAAGELIRSYYHSPVGAARKEAASPIVTEADTEAEKLIRRIVNEALPSHAVYGEEEGYQAGDGGPYEWILDPIDGTIAFSCGKPVFATLIALCREGEPILGLIDQPVTGHLWLAAEGRTTQFRDAPCQSARTTDLADARFSTTAPGMFDNGYEDVLRELDSRCWVTSYGGDAYAYGLLASGHIDIILERGLARHDIAALLPVVTNAGGVITDLEGHAFETIVGHEQNLFYDTCVTANRSLHDQVLEIIRTCRKD